MAPCWALLAAVASRVLVEATAFGPDFSSQAWSSSCVAMVCPSARASFGARRWVIVGKKPSMLEKWWRGNLGVGENCLLVREASSRAVRRPRAVTKRAAILSRGGIDITGVFSRGRLEVRSRPATILPQASRLIGLMMAGLFSLIGESGAKRG